MAISKKILAGRKIVEESRVSHNNLYSQNLTPQQLVDSHQEILSALRKKLQEIGFENESVLMDNSKEADKAEGLTEEEEWK